MADELVTPVVTPAPAPAAIDPAVIQAAVKTSITAFVEEARAKQAEEKAAAEAEERRKAGGGLDEMFRPQMEPAIQAAKGAEACAFLAEDAVNFYTDPKNADAMEHRGKIDKVVQDQAKRGNLVTRADAWLYLRGGELYETVTTKKSEAAAAKIKEAQEAAAAGAGIAQPVRFTKPLESLTTDELGAALKDVRF